MPQVFVHTREPGADGWEDGWENEMREFLRVPVVGEYLTLDMAGDWYEVQAVLHTPHVNPDHRAEVYAVNRVNGDEVLDRALTD